MMLDFDDISTYEMLIEVSDRFAITPSMSVHSEEYFRQLLSEYKGVEKEEKIRSWLEQRISEDFIAFTVRPNWLQSPQWPFVGGKPMVFVGQIDVRHAASDTTMKMLHDDTSYYLFIPKEVGRPQVITQQY